MAEATIYRFQGTKAERNLVRLYERLAAGQIEAADLLNKALELLRDLAENPGFEFVEQEVIPHFEWAIAQLARLDPAEAQSAQLFASISTLVKTAHAYLQIRAGAVSPTGDAAAPTLPMAPINDNPPS